MEKDYIADEKINLVFPDSKNFPINQETTLEELISYPVLLFEYDDHLFKIWCQGNFKKTPKDIKRRLIINSHGNIVEAMGLGLGVAVLPTHVLERSYYKNKLKTLGVEKEVFLNKIYMVYHGETKNRKRFAAFINRLKNQNEGHTSLKK